MRYHSFDRVRICETTGMQDGYLRIDVVNSENNFPIKGAEASISYGESGQTQEVLRTNLSGQTEEIAVAAPPVSLSLEEQNREKPYADYTVEVRAEGYGPVKVKGTEVLAGVLAVQPIRMIPLPAQTGAEENIQIPDHTLYGSYPPKIAEDEVKPVQESGEIVLSRVVVPQTIVVHDGVPTNASAKDYYVSYRDYIKNVASSEIYATWPRSTIVANVLAIMSFTLNRVYTEWYRNQGYDFTMTSSTAFDHKWIYGRDIFEPISEVVDDIFDNYLSRPGVRQPILTQYCDGRRVSCPGWMTQWGSCSLGAQGYSAIEILRRFYGNSIYRYQESRSLIRGNRLKWGPAAIRCGSCSSSLTRWQLCIQRSRGLRRTGSTDPKRRRPYGRFSRCLDFRRRAWSILLPGTRFLISMWGSRGLRS